MLEYIRGEVKYKGMDSLVIETGSIGYRILTSQNTLNYVHCFEEYTIYTNLVVREDSMTLYGFHEPEELEVFNLLLGVSSIGPKNALSILSTLSMSDIVKAIQQNDIQALCKAPGIGKKTASRIILELSDRVEKLVFSEPATPSHVNQELEFAVEALLNLGYARVEIDRVMLEINTEELLIEDILKHCIRKLS